MAWARHAMCALNSYTCVYKQSNTAVYSGISYLNHATYSGNVNYIKIKIALESHPGRPLHILRTHTNSIPDALRDPIEHNICSAVLPEFNYPDIWQVTMKCYL
jgi:hypothetical protein